MNENSKKIEKVITSDGRVRVELVPMPSGDNPWRTRQEYIDEQKRDSQRFYITIGTMIVTLLGVIATAWTAIVAIKGAQRQIVSTEANTLDWSNLLIGAMLGALLGYILVRTLDYVRKVRIEYKGFINQKVNFGKLYKLKFKLNGDFDPGVCCCEINVNGYKSFAKWDEAPNPLRGDNPNEFVPERVPATYYQKLFLRREYCIPILIENDGVIEVFNGWWFGKKYRYYSLPSLADKDTITVVISGNNFNWQKKVLVQDIKSKSKQME